MIDSEKRLKELYVILLYLSDEDFNKIPKEVIEAIEENMDKTYDFKIDVSKKLENQNIHEDTLALLAYINMEYLLNLDQKELMKRIYSLSL